MVKRRKLISGIGVGVVTALAGCNRSGNGNGNGMGGNQFTYPDGFSEEGIEDYETALGEESPYYNAESFTLDYTVTFELPDSQQGQERVRDIYVEVNGDEELQYIETEEGELTQEQYLENGEAFARTEFQTEEPRYQYVQNAPFNKDSAYLVSFFEQHMEDLEFDNSEVGDDNSVVEYTVNLESVNDDSQITDTYEQLVGGEIRLTVDEEGYPQEVYVELQREQQGTGPMNTDGTPTDGEQETQQLSETYELSFSAYNETTVTNPSWTEEAEEQSQQNAPPTGPNGTDGSNESAPTPTE